MTEPLRPMSTGELLDRTFRLYRQHFKLFVGIAALGPAATLVFQLLLTATNEVPGRRGASLGAAGASIGFGIVVGTVALMLGLVLSQAATVKAVAAVYLGRAISILQAYKTLKGRVWRIIGVFAVVAIIAGLAGGGIIIIAVIIGSLAVVGGAQAGTAGAVMGGLIGFAAAVAGGILAVAIWVRYSLAVQACVVEDQRIGDSLRRSAILTKGSRGRILTIYTVFFVLAWVVAIALQGVAGIAGALIPVRMVGTTLIFLAQFIAGSLTGPLATIGISLLYYDERVRKEAFDLQLMMASLDPVAPSGSPLAATP